MDFGEVGWNGEVNLPYVRSTQNFWVRPLDQPPLPDFVPDLCPWQSFELATPGHLMLARYMDYKFVRIDNNIVNILNKLALLTGVTKTTRGCEVVCWR